MTFPDDRDREIEQLLRSALHDEADALTPAGDGLSRIQRRVQTRRSHRLWLRALGAVGAVALVGGAGTLAYALTRPSQHAESITTTTPSPGGMQPAASVTPTTTASPKPAPAGFPATGFYPFTSAAAEQSWESSGGPSHDSWMLSPWSTAQLFVADFLQQPSIASVVRQTNGSNTATVVLGRQLTDGSGQHIVPVTSVQLVRFGKAWVVTGADDPGGYLRIASPASGSTVGSPVTVTGPSYGVDESISVDVRSLAGRDTTGDVSHVSFGNGSPPWSTSVLFTVPQDARGAVVAVASSPADGGPARIAVHGVTFATATVVDYPKYFYGIKNARLAKLAARNGATISYLTSAQPGGGASDPQLFGDRVYYLAGAGTCANTLMSVASTGGSSDMVASPRAGYVISSYAVSADGSRIALFETACQPTPAQPQGLLVSSVRGTATSHTIEFPSFPPMVVADPAWEPDGQHVDAVYRTGNLAGVVRWDAFAAKDQGDSQPVCGDLSQQGMPVALQVDRTGATWVAVQSGQATTVLRCLGGSRQTVFAVSGNNSPHDLAVTANGQAALLTDDSGRLWRWSTGGGNPTPIAPTVPQPNVSW